MGENLCKHLSNKKLVSEYIKSTSLNNKTTQFNPTQVNFTKEDIQMIKKHIKRYSRQLVIMETKIKVTMSEIPLHTH